MVRLSELLTAEVVDETGQSVGRVHDARFAQDGPLVAGIQHHLRLDSLVVGPDAWGVRLGFFHGGNRGPWLLSAVFGRHHHRLMVVSWNDVQEWDHERCQVVVRMARPQTG